MGEVEATQPLESVDSSELSVAEVLASMRSFVAVLDREVVRNRRPEQTPSMRARMDSVRYFADKLAAIPVLPEAPDAEAVASARRVLAFIAAWESGTVVAAQSGPTVDALHELRYEDLLILVDAVYRRAPGTS